MTEAPTAHATAAATRESRDRTAIAIMAVGIAALVIRVAGFLAPGALLWTRENDDGVMFAGAISMLHGLLPYADFGYVHPPGSLLLLVPFAAWGEATTESVGLAGARLLTAGVGALNTVLIGILLRRHGVLAILVGAGLYATWGMAVATERTYLLEPYLNLGLLIALIVVLRGRRSAPIVAGIALGVALMVKYWAVIDVVLVGWMIWSRLGRGAVLRYLAAGGITVAAIGLPFLLTDPSAMWQLTVSAQLGRAGNDVDLAERADYLSPYFAFPAIRDVVPTAASAAGVVAALVIAAFPLVGALARRARPRAWPPEAWWAIAALAHAVVLAASGVSYYHYAVWLMAPLALCLGATVGSIRRTPARRIVAGGALAVITLMAVGDVVVIGPRPAASVVEDWAADLECVAGMPSRLVVADHVGANLDAGCTMDVDPMSLALVMPDARSLTRERFLDSDEWRDRWWSYLDGADGAVLDPEEVEWLDDERRESFEREFEVVERIGRLELWSRRDR
ncbi:ArnT family glycosyltransferase [Agromyces sp. GXQ0307]|uniref:ArnT family glycosyltransferase n=1 Tax=Agromyces sp. GXQ0307 TaxID=3377835 RepID=UPI00383AC40D